MILDVICHESEFVSLKYKWNILKNQLDYSTPFQTWEWSYFYWKYFGSNKDLQIITISEDNHLLAVFPFWLRQLSGIKILEPIGTRGTDYLNLLLNPHYMNELLPVFFEWFLKSDIDLINMEDIPSKAFYLRPFLLTADTFKLYKYLNATYCPCYEIKLPDSWNAYLYILSARSRKDTEYYKRYCAKAFGNIEYISGSSSDIDTHFELHQKSRSLKNDVGTYKFVAGRDFMKDFTSAMVGLQMFRLRFLSLNNNLVASILGIDEGNKRYNISIGHDPGYRKYRPGRLLYGYDIEDCIQNRLDLYDLSRGPDSYKTQIGAEQKYNVRTVIAKSTHTKSEYIQLHLKYMSGKDYSPSSI